MAGLADPPSRPARARVMAGQTHERGWGFHHDKTPQQQALDVARKMATAARKYADANTGRNRDDLLDVIVEFERHMHRVDL